MSYVKKEQILEKAKESDFFKEIENILSEIPDADVERIRHGSWIKDNSYKNKNKSIYRCSVCNRWEAVKKDKHPCQVYFMNYCFFCGAKMDLWEKQIDSLGFGKKTVHLARGIAIAKTQHPHPKYINALLEKWQRLGLKTYNEVKAYEEQKNNALEKGDNIPPNLEDENG